ncbi:MULTISPECIES: sensor histidine kinase [unclassified Nocardiopsis]|uniref:sensor histidine kinase n=1 Tax=unclassified Nocardiopsis TaxID=2649073 RepID=UPI0013592869|nr:MULTISPECIES: sensor histidine kinase [unclassified Nocardiopsis]
MYDLLRSVWDEPRPCDPPPRRWWDWALVGVFAVAAVVEGALRPDLPLRLASVALVVALVPTLLWRRTRPLLALALAFGASGLFLLVPGAEPVEMYTTVCFLFLVHALFRWGSGREVATGSAIVLAKLLLPAPGPADAVGGFAVLFAVAALGTALRYRARARRRELDQARLVERERLARDLHDTVAHHVSAMAIRAQAGLATAPARPEAAVEALRVIESEARAALTDMRAMLRVLRRDEPAELAPSPRVGDLRRLAGRSGPGPTVDVELLGDLDDLPPAVAATVYRLAQESVTNARRHARHATRVRVRVVADDTSVRLRVSDDGDLSPLRPAPEPGYGLRGMIERADLLGGTCRAAPNPDRGWTVTAVLPRSGAAT